MWFPTKSLISNLEAFSIHRISHMSFNKTNIKKNKPELSHHCLFNKHNIQNTTKTTRLEARCEGFWLLVGLRPWSLTGGFCVGTPWRGRFFWILWYGYHWYVIFGYMIWIYFFRSKLSMIPKLVCDYVGSSSTTGLINGEMMGKLLNNRQYPTRVLADGVRFLESVVKAIPKR